MSERKTSAETNRLLADDYSAPAQRARAAHDYWAYHYAGRLRLDAIISQTIVIPDSHLLDGIYFMSTSPAEVLEITGRDLSSSTAPIEIRCRRSTLDETLKSLLIRPGSENLNAFRFESIASDQDREVLAKRLNGTDAGRLQDQLKGGRRTASAVARFLRELASDLHPDTLETIGKLEAGWNRWSDASKASRVTLRSWDRQLNVAGALEFEPLDEEDLLTIAGGRVLRDIKAAALQSNYKSDIVAVLEEARTDASGDLSQDVRAIERWYRRGRHRAFALQHQCSVAHTANLYERPAGYLETLFGAGARSPSHSRSAVETPAGLLSALAAMPTEDFTRFMQHNTDHIQSWRQSHNSNSLRNLFDSLIRWPGFSLSTNDGQSRGFLQIFASTAPKLAESSISPEAGLILSLLASPFETWLQGAYTRRIVEYCTRRTERLT